MTARTELYKARDVNHPDFDNAGDVNDWRWHIGGRTKGIWHSLTFEQRMAIALDANDLALEKDYDL